MPPIYPLTIVSSIEPVDSILRLRLREIDKRAPRVLRRILNNKCQLASTNWACCRVYSYILILNEPNLSKRPTGIVTRNVVVGWGRRKRSQSVDDDGLWTRGVRGELGGEGHRETAAVGGGWDGEGEELKSLVVWWTA